MIRALTLRATQTILRPATVGDIEAQSPTVEAGILAYGHAAWRTVDTVMVLCSERNGVMHGWAQQVLFGLGFLCALNSCAGAKVNGTSPRQRQSGIQTHSVSATNSEQPDLPEDVMQRLRDAGVADCNCNGIADSIDIYRGYALDTNHNGIIDDCDPDPDTARKARTGDRWWRIADLPDTAYFSVKHECGPVVRLRYTVPPSGAAVALTVADSSGKALNTLVNAVADNGPYTLLWDRRVDGQLLGPGSYVFRLRIGNHTYSQPMAWSR